MTVFDDREKAFEAKYRLDQETEFKVHARRDKLVGLWAAGKMGLPDDAALAYVSELIETDLLDTGEDVIFRKVLADLRARNVAVTEIELRREMDRLLLAAHDSVIRDQREGR